MSVIFSGSDALFFEFSMVFCFSCFCWPIFIIVMENQFDKINLEDLLYSSKIPDDWDSLTVTFQKLLRKWVSWTYQILTW